MWKILTFRLLVGGIVTGYVPYSILSSHPGPAPTLLSAPTVTGVFLIAVGTYVYLRCVWDFAFGGQGDAPTILVARGTYKFVRNPMYASLVLILAGESLLFESWRLLGYAAVVWLGIHLLVMLYEERILAKKFGTSYEQYCQEVPRWIPRVHRLAS